MALTTIAKIRLLNNLDTTDVSDSDMSSILEEVTKEIFSSINVSVIREKIEYLDETRQNRIDGSNKVYYVKNWKGKYLADKNLDGSVNTSDLTVYKVASDGTESTCTISSIDYSNGKLTLSTAVTSDYTLYVTYSWTYYDPVTPNAFLGLAATYLASAYCYLKADAGTGGLIKFGSVSINKKISETYSAFYDRYLEVMKKLTRGGLTSGNWIESKVEI